MNMAKQNGQYEVLSPWADADSIPKKGITPRVTDLEGKTIGLFENQKTSAKPISTAVTRELKERFPTCKFSWYVCPQDIGPASGPPKLQIDSKYKEKFEEWLKSVDTVVAAVGD
ncbi:MAG: hypothetical protein ONB05_06540 [candidate division KSB1 bacterium]|nr:hypothetical protein [candidate division KSB1 bacterium]